MRARTAIGLPLLGTTLLMACSSRATDDGVPGAGEQVEAGVDAGVDAPALSISVQPDDGQQVFVDVMGAAKDSIRLTVFLLGQSRILDILEQKIADGVRVQVILDAQQQGFNQPAYDALTSLGANIVKLSDPRYTFTHAKTVVVDERVALISSGNFDATMIAENRD